MVTAAAFLLPAIARAEPSDAVVSRLCQHVTQRKILHVDKSQPEIIWSDGAMLEVAKTFPAAVEEMISGATSLRDLRPVLRRLVSDRASEWKDARFSRSPKGDGYAQVQSSDGTLTLTVASAYFNYLKDRYPRARIRVRSTLDPIIFVIDDSIRATVMPIATKS